jgi:hypothetical protein
VPSMMRVGVSIVVRTPSTAEGIERPRQTDTLHLTRGLPFGLLGSWFGPEVALNWLFTYPRIPPWAALVALRPQEGGRGGGRGKKKKRKLALLTADAHDGDQAAAEVSLLGDAKSSRWLTLRALAG